MANQAGAMSNGTKPSKFTLDVRNLPADLEKAGVVSIFREYGAVTGIMHFQTPGTQTYQAYISYATYSEAEQAMKALHETLPLELKIKFKESHLKNLQQQERNNLDLNVPYIDHRYNPSYLDDNKDQKKAIDMGKLKYVPTAMDTKTYSSDDDLLYPVPSDPYTFNPYDSRMKGVKGRYHETNLMYTRGNVTVSEDGRRHIAYGRGYTYYELPEPHLNIGDLVLKECERREKGLYEYAEEELDDEIKDCTICSTPTAFRCQKCNIAFYCSRPCQIKDWPAHKLDCQPLPPLIKKMRSASVRNGRPAVVPPHESELPAPTSLRRPKPDSDVVKQEVPPKKDHQPIQQEQKQTPQAQSVQQQQNRQQVQSQTVHQQQSRHQNRSQSAQHQQRQQTQSQPIKQQQPPVQEAKQEKDVSAQIPPKQTRNFNSNCQLNGNKNHFNAEKPTSNFKADSSSFPVKSQQQPQNQNQQKLSQQPAKNQQKVVPKLDEDNFTFQTHEYIPKDKFVDISISSVVDTGRGTYYVQKVEDWDRIEEISEKLKEHAKNQTLVKPEVNAICIAVNDEVWYRVKIIEISDKMHVFCLDFGMYDNMPTSSVCPIYGFADVPFFSRRIQVKENSDEIFKNLTAEDEIAVKAVSVEKDGTIIVEAKKTKELKQATIPAPLTDSDPINETFASIPNIFDTLQINDDGFMIINAPISNDESVVSIVPTHRHEDFQALLQALTNDCETQLKKYPSFSPKVGELVCGKVDDEWFRGVVLTIQPVVKLALIDDGRLEVASVCTPMPNNYLNIVMFALAFKYAPNTKVPSDLPNVCFTITDTADKTNGSILLKINSDDGSFNASGSLRKWVPKQKTLSYAQLKSGHEIKILDYSKPNVYFVRSLEARELERTLRLDQDVAQYAQNKKPLTERPIVGEIVLAYFDLDKNYYRAVITCIDGERVEIKYIDYGNDYKVTFKDLYMLTEELKDRTSAVAKIKLLNVPEMPLNDDGNMYIQELIANEAALVCMFTGHPFDDGVELKSSAKKENVNDRLIQLLKPTWEKESSSDDKIEFNGDSVVPHKLGNIGDQVIVLPLCYYIANNIVMMGPNDMVAAEAQEQLDNRILEYVKNTDMHYIPRENELCIAKYEGQYYRALCMTPSATPTKSRVHFIDWGNTEVVEHKDIRQITKDFVSQPAFVTECNLSTICGTGEEHKKVRERINEVLEINSAIDIKIIDCIDGELVIDVPKLREQLLNEHLI